MAAPADTPELAPIDEVARALGIRASAIRYYEERGLVAPAARRGGRRWYGPAEVRRLATILFWSRSGMMSLDRIAELLAGSGAPWSRHLREQIDVLTADAERMLAARDLLEHVLAHHHDGAPDGCPHYEAVIWERRPDPPEA